MREWGSSHKTGPKNNDTKNHNDTVNAVSPVLQQQTLAHHPGQCHGQHQAYSILQHMYSQQTYLALMTCQADTIAGMDCEKA